MVVMEFDGGFWTGGGWRNDDEAVEERERSRRRREVGVVLRALARMERRPVVFTPAAKPPLSRTRPGSLRLPWVVVEGLVAAELVGLAEGATGPLSNVGTALYVCRGESPTFHNVTGTFSLCPQRMI